MIALDSNVLVRFLVEDDPEQSRQAKGMLQRAIAADSPCLVSEVVVSLASSAYRRLCTLYAATVQSSLGSNTSSADDFSAKSHE